MIDKELYNVLKDLVEVRYPSRWGGAAAVRVEDGTIYTSVAPEVFNDSTVLCMESGAIWSIIGRNYSYHTTLSWDNKKFEETRAWISSLQSIAVSG